MKKIVSTLIALMMVLVCFAGCSSTPAADSDSSAPAADSTAASEDAASGDAIKVGVLAPLTGSVAEYGVAVANGIKMYVEEFNAAGGINGKQIQLIEYDEEGDSAKAVTGYNSLVDQGVTAIIGDVTTAPTVAVVVESQADQMPMITASATADAVTVAEDGTVYENMFRSCFIDPFQGEKMAPPPCCTTPAPTIPSAAPRPSRSRLPPWVWRSWLWRAMRMAPPSSRASSPTLPLKPPMCSLSRITTA